MLLYLINNTVNPKVYVGITTISLENRWRQHLKHAKAGTGNCEKLYNAMRYYGIENFQIALIEEYGSIEELKQAEIAKIAELNSVQLGYNITEGGEGARGYQHTKEHIEKMRVRMAGNNYGTGNRSKRGYVDSETTRQRRSVSHLGNQNRRGKADSDITKQRKSAAQKLRWAERKKQWANPMEPSS